jgi:hypothetical protein
MHLICLSNVFNLLEYYPLAYIQTLDLLDFFLSSNNSHSQKVKPCDRTARFSRRVALSDPERAPDRARWRGGLFNVSPPMPCRCIFSLMTTFTLCFMMGKGHDSRHSLGARLGSASTSSDASYLMNAHPRAFCPIHFIYPLDKL